MGTRRTSGIARRFIHRAPSYPHTPDADSLVLLYDVSHLLDVAAYHAEDTAPNRIGRVMI
jgi:hypothetical protein